MDEDDPVSTSPVAAPSQRAQQRRSDGSEPHLADKNKCERVLITNIRATDVVAGLRRMPAGFYVAVEIDGKFAKTLNKPALLGKDVVEWDEEIFLPSERSFAISFGIYASFELGPMLGDGEVLHRCKITVGEVLDRSEQLRPIRFLGPRDKEVFPSCSSLSITTERRICDVNESTSTLDLPESDTMSQLGQLTDAGHCALLRYRQRQNQRDLDEAIASFERVCNMCPPNHPNRSSVLSNLATAMFIRCQVNNASLHLDVPIILYRDALQLRPSSHSDHCTTALDLSFALLSRLRKRGDEADRSEAKSLVSKVLELSPVDGYAYRAACFTLQMADSEISPPIRTIEPVISETNRGEPCEEGLSRAAFLRHSVWDPYRLAGLGMFLCRRFDRNGDIADIHGAITMMENAVQNASDGHPGKPKWLNNLGAMLSRRFERLGGLEDINKAILVEEEAVHLTPDGHPNKPTWLYNLGSSLSSRFEHLGDLEDINKSISMLEEAVRLAADGHLNKATLFNNLGLSFLNRFKRLGYPGDVNKSTVMFEEAVHFTPDGHPDKPGWLNNLGNSLSRRFERLGDLEDINKAISVKEEAVCLTPDDHPDKPAWLMNLGSSLSCRFERLGDLEDISKSISMGEEAVRLTPDGHPGKPDQLNSLGSSLLNCFKRLGDLKDINKAISMVEEAVRLAADGHLNEATMFDNLGLSLSSRFERLGNLADINKSISMLKEAVHLTPDGHTDKPSRLNNLGNSLSNRFDRFGDPEDMNMSISMFEKTTRLTPDGHPDKPGWLNNLGSSLFKRFNRFGDPADMNMSISMGEEAVCLTPDDHPSKPSLLNNLGLSLLSRFKRLGYPGDVNKSTAMFEEAVRLTPDGHPDKLARLNNLGGSLFRRFEHLGDREDINKAISVGEEAVRLTPDGHPDKPAWLINLGNSLIARFEHSGDHSSLSAATLYFSVTARASICPTSVRFLASRSWVSSARRQGNSQVLLDAYATSVNLLPELAWIGLPLAERHRLLLTAANVARNPAVAAVEAGFPEMAVEWLEQGRSIVWSQFLQLRTPVDELRVEHPILADQFQHISQELEQASSRENSTSHRLASDSGPDSDTLSLEKETQRRQELAISRGKLLADIRSLPGFDRFLLPKTIQQLATSAHSGPVVYLNAAEQRCDALIVTEHLGNVLHVPLPNMNYPRAKFLRELLRLSLKQNHLIVSRDEISALLPSEENLTLQDLLNLSVMGDGNERSDRAVKVKPQRIDGYTPDDLFRFILVELWEKVVRPILDSLGFSAPRSGGEKMTRIFWCPTGPFAFLPIHAAGLHHLTSPGTKLSDFVISSYTPTLGALAPPPQEDASSASSNIRLVAVPQPPTDGLTRLAFVPREINHIKTLSSSSPFVTFQDSHGTVEDVLEKMAGPNSDWVHFACHGVQDPDNPLDSGLGLADGRRLKLSDIIRLSRPRGGLAFLSACQTAQGDEKLSEESVHLAAGMLLAGYSGVVATMWSIMDPDAPKVTKDVYEHLFRDGKAPDSTEAAEALHYAVQHLRDSGASFFSWVPFIHFGI